MLELLEFFGTMDDDKTSKTINRNVVHSCRHPQRFARLSTSVQCIKKSYGVMVKEDEIFIYLFIDIL